MIRDLVKKNALMPAKTFWLSFGQIAFQVGTSHLKLRQYYHFIFSYEISEFIDEYYLIISR